MKIIWKFGLDDETTEAHVPPADAVAMLELVKSVDIIEDEQGATLYTYNGSRLRVPDNLENELIIYLDETD